MLILILCEYHLLNCSQLRSQLQGRRVGFVRLACVRHTFVLIAHAGSRGHAPTSDEHRPPAAPRHEAQMADDGDGAELTMDQIVAQQWQAPPQPDDATPEEKPPPPPPLPPAEGDAPGTLSTLLSSPLKPSISPHLHLEKEM